jgi:hypothetical protein
VNRAASVALAQLHFDASGTPALFGNRDELIEEWLKKLGMAMEARWGTAITAAGGGDPDGASRP